MAGYWIALYIQFIVLLVVQLQAQIASKDVNRQGKALAKGICDDLRSQIMAGVYRPGSALPSTRALAAELGVSRTTVTAAYAQLLAEGFLQSRQGAKTKVAPALQRATPQTGRPPRTARPVRLSTYGRHVLGFSGVQETQPQTLFADFRYGELSGRDFPALQWKRALSAAALRQPDRLRYDDPLGSVRLRSQLQAYLWRARTLRCDVDQIVVVNGSQQGMDLCARLLVDPGDTAVVEDPGYIPARQVLTAAGARVVPVEVDGAGLRTDRLEGIAKARLCYVTPSHQFPLGSILSASRRQELLAWARRSNAMVIEDDYDSEYRFDIDPIRPLRALGDSENVIYLGTISKTLSPTIRLGYLVIPAGLQQAFRNAKRLADRHTPTLEQEVLADFLASGAYERHVRRVRLRNASRRAALLGALSAELGRQVRVAGADAGLHVVAWFDEISKQREAALIKEGRAAGIGLYPVTPLYSSPGVSSRPRCAGLILGYAALDEAKIKRGISRLARVVNGMGRDLS